MERMLGLALSRGESGSRLAITRPRELLAWQESVDYIVYVLTEGSRLLPPGDYIAVAFARSLLVCRAGPN